MTNVPLFLHRWYGAEYGRPKGHFPLRRSAFGNVNLFGVPTTAEAPDLTPNDGDWFGGLEAGVRPLVFAVVKIGAITYDSCEGHAPPPPVRPTPRRVGILATTVTMADRLTQTLISAAARYKNRWEIRFLVYRSRLYDTVNDSMQFETIEIVLDKEPGITWPQYFERVDAATAHVVACLANLPQE